MNYSDIVTLISGVLQLGVACYALRLGRFFGKTPLRWLLYSGVPLLALTYLLISVGPLRGANVGITMDIIHGLFSILLIAGMVQLEVLLKEHLRAEKAERDLRSGVDSKVKQQLTDLAKANEEWPKMHEELQQTATRLEAELNEQKLAVAELTKNNETLIGSSEELQQNDARLRAEISELTQSNAGLQQVKELSANTNEELRRTISTLESNVNELNTAVAELTQTKDELTQTKVELINANNELATAKEELQQAVAHLQAEIDDLKRLQEATEKAQEEMVTASRQAGMNQVANSVLKKVTGILDTANSVSEMATRLTESRIVPLVRISKLMWKGGAKPARCLTRNPRTRQARQLPDNLARLARHLSTEQTLLLKKIDSVKKKIENIKDSVATNSTEEYLARTAAILFQPEPEVQPEPEIQPQPEEIQAETETTETVEATVEATVETTVEVPVENAVETAVETVESSPATAEVETVEEQPQTSEYTLQVGETETATTETATATEESTETTEPELQVESKAAPQAAKPESKRPQPVFAPPPILPPVPQESEDLGAESFDVDSF